MATPAAQAQTKPATPESGPCSVLLRLAARALESFAHRDTAPELSPCLEGKGGAYALVVTYESEATHAEDYGGGYYARRALLHANPQGEIASTGEHRFEASAESTESWTLEGLHDFDGDGVDEAMMLDSLWQYESNGSYDREVWRVEGERVRYYSPAGEFHVVAFKDFDHDGRLDLEVAKRFEGNINECGPNGEPIEFGPTIVAHNVAGRFEYDHVSQTEAKRHCPERPTEIVPRVPGGVDNTELRRRLACAVMWGVPADTIAGALMQGCPPWPRGHESDSQCEHEGVFPGCVNLRQLLVWTKTKPQLLLR